MKRFAALCAGALALAAAAWAAPDGRLAEADAAYAQGAFETSAARYDELISEGWAGFELFYNRGNAAYRLGRLGEARLWYERARALKPQDEDVRHNIRIISERVDGGAQEPDRQDAARRWLAWTTAAANMVFFGLAAWNLFRPIESLWWLRWSAGLLLAASLAAWWVAGPPVPAGVAAQGKIEARSGPGDDFEVAFTVPEGGVVTILEASGDWTLVGVPDKGLKGWARAGGVARVETAP